MATSFFGLFHFLLMEVDFLSWGLFPGSACTATVDWFLLWVVSLVTGVPQEAKDRVRKLEEELQLEKY